MKIKFIALISITFIICTKVWCQKCDCDIYPITQACKDTCGIKLLQIGTKAQLKKKLNLDDETAQQVVNLKSRKSKKTIASFQNVLTYKYYVQLENKYNLWISGSNITQTNTYGDNVGRDKITNNFNVFQNEFRPLAEEFKNAVNKLLANLATKYPQHPITFIQIESGNSQRHLVAMSLEEIFTKYNLGRYPKGNTFIGRYPDNPISVFVNNHNIDFANELINSIKPFIQSEFTIISSDNPSNEIIIYINGQPLFNLSGQVRIQ